jgi:membrane protease YdiL (CAAX protease family)
MKKQNRVFQYVIAYGMWFVNLGLATWLLYISRFVLLVVPALLFNPEDYSYPKRAETLDKIFTLLLGIGWLAFMVITEEYFRAGVLKGNLTKRVTRVTGLVLLCVFVVDSILFGLQGFAGNGLRWLMLAVELAIGFVLVAYSRKSTASNPI